MKLTHPIPELDESGLCDRLNALFDRYRQAGAIMHRISLEFF